MNRERGHGSAWWSYCRDYADIGPCVELGATYDDTLKKDEHFTEFAMRVAQRVAFQFDPKAKVTWGKWGARLEAEENEHLDGSGLMALARRIVQHPSWTGLCLATHVFTFGKDEDE